MVAVPICFGLPLKEEKERTMTTRERFNKVMHWQEADRVPNMDFGYWDETVTIWHKQGLPAYVKTNQDIEQYLGLEGAEIIPRLPVANGLYPPFQDRVLEDRGRYRLVQNTEGNICEVPKDGTSIPHYVKYVVQTPRDWQTFKRERLDYTREDRIGEVKKVVEEAHLAGMPVLFDAGSLYGWLRNWMGVENFSLAIMNQREWVEEMMEHLTEMTLYLIEKALPGVDIDMAWWWEDMCFNHGPLISPRLFEELMVPRYRRITDTLRKYKVDINVLDCDGQIYQLIPGWLKGGINCMFPIEAAHTDPVRLRQECGKDILLMGGVNKVQLAKGKEAIDEELKRLRPLVEKGGYIPTVDHRVPPDVSFENYLYYLEKKKEIL